VKLVYESFALEHGCYAKIVFPILFEECKDPGSMLMVPNRVLS
jgi:hypothetical protein